MARRGDGIYLRGRTWWLDFSHQGRRHGALRPPAGQEAGRHASPEITMVYLHVLEKGRTLVDEAFGQGPRDAVRPEIDRGQ